MADKVDSDYEWSIAFCEVWDYSHLLILIIRGVHDPGVQYQLVLASILPLSLLVHLRRRMYVYVDAHLVAHPFCSCDPTDDPWGSFVYDGVEVGMNAYRPPL